MEMRAQTVNRRQTQETLARQGLGPWPLLVLFVLLAAGCTPQADSAAPNSAIATQPAVLSIYNWDTYIDDQILDDFERQYGVQINYQVYDNDSDMIEEIRTGETTYDLVVPSDFNVSIMREEGLLAPLDKTNIPNFSNIDPTFINPVFDPANRFCAPYQWGTVGIGYNIAATGREILTWADFFDPVFAGRVALLDDYRTTMGIALLLLGYSPNTTNANQIAEAAAFLNSRSQHIGTYAGDDAQDRLLSGEFDMVMEWSGDVFQVMEENADIRYVIPEDGSIIWTDNICIPANAPNKVIAEAFINYLLEPEVGALLSNYMKYGTPNLASLPSINEEDLNNPAIYPSEDVLDRLFFLVDVNIAADIIYDAAWNQILAEHSQRASAQ